MHNNNARAAGLDSLLFYIRPNESSLITDSADDDPNIPSTTCLYVEILVQDSDDST